MTDQSIEDASRKEFEAHFHFIDPKKTKDSWGKVTYAYSHVEAMWEGWQAARQSSQSEPVGTDVLEKVLSHYEEGISAALSAGRTDGVTMGDMSEQEYRGYSAMRQSITQHREAIRNLLTQPESGG
jgi:hypothetical protein